MVCRSVERCRLKVPIRSVVDLGESRRRHIWAAVSFSSRTAVASRGRSSTSVPRSRQSSPSHLLKLRSRSVRLSFSAILLTMLPDRMIDSAGCWERFWMRRRVRQRNLRTRAEAGSSSPGGKTLKGDVHDRPPVSHCEERASPHGDRDPRLTRGVPIVRRGDRPLSLVLGLWSLTLVQWRHPPAEQ
jgi:hypothetical protein